MRMRAHNRGKNGYVQPTIATIMAMWTIVVLTNVFRPTHQPAQATWGHQVVSGNTWLKPSIHYALRSGVSLHLRLVKIKTARSGRFKILISWRSMILSRTTIYKFQFYREFLYD